MDNFNEDICQAFISANIPLFKLQNPSLRAFLEKYTKRHIPDESTLRKNYVKKCYSETMNNIRSSIGDHNIWISIDETTDCEGRYVANVIVGTLEIDRPSQTFLLHSEALEKTNHSTIAQLFDRALSILWPTGIRHNKVLLFLSDAAPYMIKSGKSIKSFYPKVVHITCVAHGLHRVAEEIRNQFPQVDELISNVKKVFLKAPSRTILFRNMAPNLALPPQPILTRWGTWLNAAFYYCDNLEIIKEIILQLNSEDSISIKKSQDLIKDPNLKTNLI